MKLLQVPTVELEQRIKEEMEVNPALEEGKEDDELEDEVEEYEEDDNSEEEDFDISDYLDDDETPDYKLSVKNQGADPEEKDVPLGSGRSFHEVLRRQLGLRSTRRSLPKI